MTFTVTQLAAKLILSYIMAVSPAFHTQMITYTHKPRTHTHALHVGSLSGFLAVSLSMVLRRHHHHHHHHHADAEMKVPSVENP